MRDRDTFNAAMHAAETGHLVFGTIHASTAPSTISRILDLFPRDMHPAMRQNLAFNLKAVVAQKLLPTTKEWPREDGITRVPTRRDHADQPDRPQADHATRKTSSSATRSGSARKKGCRTSPRACGSSCVAEKIERATAFEVAPSAEVPENGLKGITITQPGIL